MKNLFFYLSPHPYFLCPVFSSPLALSKTSPFLPHSFTLHDSGLCPKIPIHQDSTADSASRMLRPHPSI